MWGVLEQILHNQITEQNINTLSPRKGEERTAWEPAKLEEFAFLNQTAVPFLFPFRQLSSLTLSSLLHVSRG
jgi:hypothetical protein